MACSLKNYSALVLILAILATLPGKAQDFPPSYYLEKYDGEFAVKLVDHHNVNIEVKRGELQISQHIYQENLFLDKRASGHSNTTIDYEPPFSRIESLDAYTLKPETDKDKYDRVKVRDIRDEQLMHEEYFDGRRAKVFTFPGVKEGAITVIEYEKTISEPRLLGSEVFQSYYAKEEQIFKLAYDEEVQVNIQYMNCTEDDFYHQVEEKSGQFINTWQLKNPQKLKEEGSMPEFLRMVPHIVYRIKSYAYKDEEIPVLRDVNDLKDWYMEFLGDVPNDHSEQIDRITDSLVAGVNSDHEKVRLIFNWVQNNIKYIAIEEGLQGFHPRAPSKVIAKRYGDCKDMSCLSIAMLRHAGIPAYYTWVGTRDLPYSYHQVPSPLSDNHMIASVKLGDELIFLDATDEGLPYPLPSSFIQGKEALVVYKPDSFRVEEVPVVTPDKNLIKDSLLLHLEGADLKASGTREFYGYYSSRMSRHLNTMDGEERKKVLQPNLRKGNNKCRSFGYDVSVDPDKVKVNYQLEIPGYVYQNEEELILNLNLEKIMNDYQIKKDRQHPLTNNFKYRIDLQFSLQIPEGYQVKYLPENDAYQHDKFSFTLSYRQPEGSLVEYHLKAEVNHMRIEPDQFEAWNEMIKQLNKNYNETIILQKQ
ncbi:MAG: DUF3857 domain-containing protein [Owenweeksia sp.]|nr:DUF3857 domain-containing protein [Owenweeksia sp.]